MQPAFASETLSAHGSLIIRKVFFSNQAGLRNSSSVSEGKFSGHATSTFSPVSISRGTVCSPFDNSNLRLSADVPGR